MQMVGQEAKFTTSKGELLSLTKVSRGLGQLMDQIKSKALEKIIILKNNEPEAAIIPLEEYLRLKEIADTVELFDIHKIVSERMKDTNQNFVSMDDMFARVDKARS